MCVSTTLNRETNIAILGGKWKKYIIISLRNTENMCVDRIKPSSSNLS